MTPTARRSTPVKLRHILTIEMPVELYQQLGKAAEAEERPMAWVVRAAIREYIGRQENGS